MPGVRRVTAAVAPLLTARQRRILDFIRGHYIDNGYCPAVREIAEGCGLASPSAAVYQLRQLELAGWIRRVPNRARAITVLNPVDGSDS